MLWEVIHQNAPFLLFTISECLTLPFHLHLSLSIYDSLPLIKYSQLVPLNIHCAALLRLSALRQSASSECTSSPPKSENAHAHAHVVCLHGLRCGSLVERGESKGWLERAKERKTHKKGNDRQVKNETREKIRWRQKAKKSSVRSTQQLLSMFSESREALHLNNSTAGRVPQGSPSSSSSLLLTSQCHT